MRIADRLNNYFLIHFFPRKWLMENPLTEEEAKIIIKSIRNAFGSAFEGSNCGCCMSGADMGMEGEG